MWTVTAILRVIIICLTFGAFVYLFSDEITELIQAKTEEIKARTAIIKECNERLIEESIHDED